MKTPKCNWQILFLDNTFLHVLNKYSPIETKVLRASHFPYMTKILRKATIKWANVKTKFIMNNAVISLNSYKKKNEFL